jgi:hypothetical protein
MLAISFDWSRTIDLSSSSPTKNRTTTIAMPGLEVE